MPSREPIECYGADAISSSSDNEFVDACDALPEQPPVLQRVISCDSSSSETPSDSLEEQVRRHLESIFHFATSLPYSKHLLRVAEEIVDRTNSTNLEEIKSYIAKNKLSLQRRIENLGDTITFPEMFERIYTKKALEESTVDILRRTFPLDDIVHTTECLTLVAKEIIQKCQSDNPKDIEQYIAKNSLEVSKKLENIQVRIMRNEDNNNSSSDSLKESTISMLRTMFSLAEDVPAADYLASMAEEIITESKEGTVEEIKGYITKNKLSLQRQIEDEAMDGILKFCTTKEGLAPFDPQRALEESLVDVLRRQFAESSLSASCLTSLVKKVIEKCPGRTLKEMEQYVAEHALELRSEAKAAQKSLEGEVKSYLREKMSWNLRTHAHHDYLPKLAREVITRCGCSSLEEIKTHIDNNKDGLWEEVQKEASSFSSKEVATLLQQTYGCMYVPEEMVEELAEQFAKQSIGDIEKHILENKKELKAKYKLVSNSYNELAQPSPMPQQFADYKAPTQFPTFDPQATAENWTIQHLRRVFVLGDTNGLLPIAQGIIASCGSTKFNTIEKYIAEHHMDILEKIKAADIPVMPEELKAERPSMKKHQKELWGDKPRMLVPQQMKESMFPPLAAPSRDIHVDSLPPQFLGVEDVEAVPRRRQAITDGDLKALGKLVKDLASVDEVPEDLGERLRKDCGADCMDELTHYVLSNLDTIVVTYGLKKNAPQLPQVPNSFELLHADIGADIPASEINSRPPNRRVSGNPKFLSGNYMELDQEFKSLDPKVQEREEKEKRRREQQEMKERSRSMEEFVELRREGLRLDTSSLVSVADDVEELDLSKRNLHDVPDLSRFRRLTTLNLSYNNLSTLHDIPATVTTIFLDYNRLQHLTNLPYHLKKLSARNNELTSVAHLPPFLQSADLSNNKIDEVIEVPRMLEKLILRNNKLRELPQLVAYVEELDVSFNFISQITSLPETLRVLRASHNPLTLIKDLPAGLEKVVVDNVPRGSVLEKRLKLINEGRWKESNGRASSSSSPYETLFEKLNFPTLKQAIQQLQIRYNEKLHDIIVRRGFCLPSQRDFYYSSSPSQSRYNYIGEYVLGQQFAQ